KGTNADDNVFDLSGVNVQNGWSVEMQNGDDTVIGGGVDDLTYDLGNGDDTFTGTAARKDTVLGGNGEDDISTGDGNDVVDGGDDADTIDTGAGNDTIKVSDTFDALDDEIDGGDGYDIIDNTGGTLFLRNINDGSTGAGTVNNVEQISGSGGVLKGTNADDNVFDLSGVNVQNGWSVEMQNGDDTVIASVQDDLTYDLGNGDDSFTTTGARKDTVLGGKGSDTITTGDGNDVVDGGDDADVIDTGAGNDTIKVTGMEALDDTVDAGAGGSDRLDFEGTGSVMLRGLNDGSGISGIELLYGNGQTLRGTDSGDDTFDFSAINVNGGSVPLVEMRGGDDTVVSAGVNDSLTYDLGAGNDSFTSSGAGLSDTVTGGSGDDTFVFVANFGTDTITDFTKGEDLIDLSGFGLSDVSDLAISTSGANTEIDVTGDTTFGKIVLENFAGSLGNADFDFV
ncbi:hypothetical protein AVJ23_20395, partial [Pseudoponticoccus marisrubri]